MTGIFNALSVKLRWVAEWRGALQAYDRRAGRSRLPGPRKLHLQTVDRCNGACVSCPYPAKERSGPSRRMSEDLFDDLLQQYARAGTVRSCLLMLQNEPFLDPGLAERIRVAKKLLGPRAVVQTVTNGTILPDGWAATLKEAGLDQIHVSIDAATEETVRRLRPGHDFGQVRANARTLLRTFGSGVTVKFLPQRANQGEEKAFLRYWKGLGAKVKFGKLTNRAGALGDFASLRSRRPDLARRVLSPALRRLVPCCPLPFTAACVLWDGRAILCCHDWGPADVIGDLSRERAQDVWNGSRVGRHRTLLLEGRSGQSGVCRDCSLAPVFLGE
ncbi:MAG: radical SAM protein [Proteobacteria bacterium]|nr:radical SAM protein [Pseudomonadota bacterium]